MQQHLVRTYRSDEQLPRSGQLAWKLAELAADPVEVDDDVTEMIVNRIIDNASVATASLTRRPVVAARAQALDHPTSRNGNGVDHLRARGRRPGRRRSGPPGPTGSRSASWTTTTRSSPPSTRTPVTTSRRSSRSPSTRGATGRDLVRGIATGYEIQVDLVRAISLHQHKIDHVAHLGPSAAAGIGTLLHLPADDDLPGHRPGAAHHHRDATVTQGRDLVVEGVRTRAGRQGRRRGGRPGDARRIQPDPDLRGRGRRHRLASRRTGRVVQRCRCPAPASPSAAILDTYTKEHSAEYQAQALIDLARKLNREHPEIGRSGQGRSNREHPHQDVAPHPPRHRVRRERPAEVRPDRVPRDARPLDPVHLRGRAAGRRWHHVDSYAPERAQRPDTVALWRKVTTTEEAGVDEAVPLHRSGREGFRRRGCRHPDRRLDHRRTDAGRRRASAGRRPFAREQYIGKFRTLADGVLESAEIDRFLDLVQRLPDARRRRVSPA